MQSGNDAPDERPITSELKESYVNKLYIQLAGRKSTESELSLADSLLGDEASDSSREQLIDQIIATDAYKIKMYADARGDYLDNVDLTTIQTDYFELLFLLPTIPPSFLDAFMENLQRHNLLYRIPGQLDSNLIGVIEVHKRVINNDYYDDINMGTENFVVACFQNFLFRYPTQSELENATDMIEGISSSLFFGAGNSKEDFMDIFFESDDYFEGQVINLYRKYLFRDPSTTEMFTLTQEYFTDRNYGELQKEILSSNEYFYNE